MEQAVNTKVVMVLFKSDGARRDFRLRNATCVIGRQPDCDLQAPDTRVSRKHCQIRIDDEGRVFAKDLGSSNGTYVNDERQEEEVELSPGDRLAVGGFIFTVQINGEPEEIEPPLFDAPGASGGRVAMRGDTGAAGSGSSPQTAPATVSSAPTDQVEGGGKDPSSESSVAGIDDLIDAAIAESRDDEDSVDDDDFDDEGSSVIEFDPDKDA